MISRRTWLHLTAQATAACVAAGRLLFGRTAFAGQRRPAEAPDSMNPDGKHWDTFLHELQALTRAQYAPDWSETPCRGRGVAAGYRRRGDPASSRRSSTDTAISAWLS